MVAEPTRGELAAALVQLRRRVDDHFAAAVQRSPGAFACREGCDACCHRRFSVFGVEAAALREALTALAAADPPLRARIRAQADDPAAQGRCALLVDGRCSVYAARPLICRSHGLPIAVEDESGRVRVDACPLNFREGPPPPASVLRLAALNQPLAVLAELWRRGEPRVALEDLARAADPAAASSPNFPVDDPRSVE